jgi:DNA-binding NarL/FixJ family response regulator
MLRVAVVDHHPAVRAGLEAILGRHPIISVVGAAADRCELWPLLYRTDPNVLVMGQPQRDHAPGLCLRVRARHPRCRVVIYAGGEHVAVAAAFAGAFALVDRSADMRALVDAVVAAGSGERRLPPLTASMRRQAAERLDPADRAILAMRLAGTAPHEIAETVGIARAQLDGRFAGILAELAGRARPAATGASSRAHVA